MRALTLSVCLLVFFTSRAQNAVSVSDSKNKTLAEQYFLMKKNANTFEDYKVIKEYALDVMWKSVSDSLKVTRVLLENAKAEIAVRENDINTLRSSLKQKEGSMADVVLASTHIKVFGANFSKGFFLFLVVLVASGLLVVIVAMTGRVKLMYFAMKEKIENLNMLTSEYEDFRRKALEKQMKLSRELQTERNKLSEFKVQKA